MCSASCMCTCRRRGTGCSPSSTPSSPRSHFSLPRTRSGTRASKRDWKFRRCSRFLLCMPGLDLGQADVGCVVGLGSAPDLGRGAALRHDRHSRAAAVRRGSAAAGGVVVGRDDHRRGRPADRLLLGQVVELAAPAAVDAADRLLAVPPAAAHQRIRHSCF